MPACTCPPPNVSRPRPHPPPACLSLSCAPRRFGPGPPTHPPRCKIHGIKTGEEQIWGNFSRLQSYCLNQIRHKSGGFFYQMATTYLNPVLDPVHDSIIHLATTLGLIVRRQLGLSLLCENSSVFAKVRRTLTTAVSVQFPERKITVKVSENTEYFAAHRGRKFRGFPVWNQQLVISGQNCLFPPSPTKPPPTHHFLHPLKAPSIKPNLCVSFCSFFAWA